MPDALPNASPNGNPVVDSGSTSPEPPSEILTAESRNILTLSAHYISLRLGWIFKTETVIMPAFMDAISGAGWLRGCLPVVNRICSSLPPLFYAPQLKGARRKKVILSVATFAMAIPFVVLAATWWRVGQPGIGLAAELPGWLPALFLACYGVVFVATGVQRLAWATVQGKLIRDNRRGRLLAVSGLLGSIISVTAVLLLIPGWLERPDHGFGWIFLMTAAGFVVAGSLVWLVIEPPDADTTTPRRRPGQLLLEAWDLFSSNRSFRRIACVAMLFISIQLAFPHFQTLGREMLGDEQRESGSYLMHWVVAQNIGFGVCTFLFGWLADFFGNRVVIRTQILLLASVPLVALWLGSLADNSGSGFYWITFSLLGLTPLTFRTINNYVLELAPPSEHPRYIATLNLAMTAPFFASPAVGWMVDRYGFEPIFVLVSIVVACGALLTFGMAEPRLDEHLEESSPVDPSPTVE